MKREVFGIEMPLGDIKGFSRAVYKLLGAAAIFYALVITLHILSELWSILGGTVDVVSVGGWWPFELQLLRIGQSSVFIPASNFGLTVIGVNVTMPVSAAARAALVLTIALIAHGLLMTCLLYVRAMFGELKDGVSPFSSKMVTRILMLAVIITLLTVADLSLSGIMLMVIMWLVYYIFEYGRKLQDESDTTL